MQQRVEDFSDSPLKAFLAWGGINHRPRGTAPGGGVWKNRTDPKHHSKSSVHIATREDVRIPAPDQAHDYKPQGHHQAEPCGAQLLKPASDADPPDCPPQEDENKASFNSVRTLSGLSSLRTQPMSKAHRGIEHPLTDQTTQPVHVWPRDAWRQPNRFGE
jgi:hypothetical protein